MGRYSCQPHTFTAADGDLITLRCHGAEGWPQLIASLIAPTSPSSSAPNRTDRQPIAGNTRAGNLVTGRGQLRDAGKRQHRRARLSRPLHPRG